MNPPCRNCTLRHMGCHISCEKYAAFAEARARFLKDKSQKNDVYAYEAAMAATAEKAVPPQEPIGGHDE